MTPRLLTQAELAAALGMSYRSVSRYLKDGTLTRLGLVEANRIGKRRLFAADSVQAVLFRRRVGGLRRTA